MEIRYHIDGINEDRMRRVEYFDAEGSLIYRWHFHAMLGAGIPMGRDWKRVITRMELD